MLQRAITLKDLTSVFAGRVFSKVDMNINVQVNIQPSTSRYQMDTLKMSSSFVEFKWGESGWNDKSIVKIGTYTAYYDA